MTRETRLRVASNKRMTGRSIRKRTCASLVTLGLCPKMKYHQLRWWIFICPKPCFCLALCGLAKALRRRFRQTKKEDFASLPFKHPLFAGVLRLKIKQSVRSRLWRCPSRRRGCGNHTSSKNGKYPFSAFSCNCLQGLRFADKNPPGPLCQSRFLLLPPA